MNHTSYAKICGKSENNSYVAEVRSIENFNSISKGKVYEDDWKAKKQILTY